MAPEYDNGTCVTQNQFEFHTEWSDGNAHSAGFTTAWPPNKVILDRSTYKGLDPDLNGRNEEDGGPTLAAINSRSYHPGVSRPCSATDLRGSSGAQSTVNSAEALGTVAGNDLVGGDGY